MNLGPAVEQQLKAGLLDEKCSAILTMVELVVAGDNPDTERGGKAAQNWKEFTLGLAVPFEEISQQNHEVRLLCLHLGDTRFQPAFAE